MHYNIPTETTDIDPFTLSIHVTLLERKPDNPDNSISSYISVTLDYIVSFNILSIPIFYDHLDYLDNLDSLDFSDILISLDSLEILDILKIFDSFDTSDSLEIPEFRGV